jgi:hypothetical protein
MNDLVLLRYGWGHRPGDGSGLTDCFQLTCEVRRRLGLADYADRFAWVYERYDEATLPRSSIARWLLQHGERLTNPRPGAVALLPGASSVALGTVTEHGVIFLAPGQNVVHAPVPAGLARYFWMTR